MRKDPAKRHTVVALVADELSTFEFGIAAEVFGIDQSAALGVPWYRFLVASPDPSPVTTVTPGVTVNVTHGLRALSRADTVVVLPSRLQDDLAPDVVAALRRAHARGARIVSACTGAFTLAAAGLLHGRRSTTHWRHAAELARRYPTSQVDPRVLYVEDEAVYTSAGSAAFIDLCLHIVRGDFGAEVANEIARSLVVPPHREGGQAQFVAQSVPDISECQDLFGDTLEWAQGQLDQDLSVDLLARRAAMSPRTFARHFVATTGTTPHRWLLNQRVLLAQRLLETTDLSIDGIADRCGLGTAANLRQQFQRVVGTAPGAYRRTFRMAG